MDRTERDQREVILNSLLTSPHRDLASHYPIHQTLITLDPRFYVHLAAWYADHGVLRDHKELFVATLCTSKNTEYRAVGLTLLHRLPPYEVARVVDFVKGRRVRVRQPVTRWPNDSSSIENQVPRNGSSLVRAQRLWQRIFKGDSEENEAFDRDETRSQACQYVSESVGLCLNVPRSMKTGIEAYLRAREADDSAFDRTVITARNPLKRLYAGLHIRPSERAQAILFDNNPPVDSLPYVVKQIACMDDPGEQARTIVQHRIPYRVACAILKNVSPMALASLIDAMSPQEMINNIKSLKQRGAFENPLLREMIEDKLQMAKGDARVSAYKAKVAIKAVGATGRLASTLGSITEANLKNAGRITRDTALLIDKSGSMHRSLEVGKKLGAMVSTISEASFYAYAFDTIAYPIEPDTHHLFSWERAMADLHAGGPTSCGIALELMRRIGQRVEQIVLVTDENENHPPFFKDVFPTYVRDIGIRPDVTIIKIGHASDRIERACFTLGFSPNVFEFRGDYYSLPNVIPMLAYPSLTEMVMEILDYPLPTKQLSFSRSPVLKEVPIASLPEEEVRV